MPANPPEPPLPPGATAELALMLSGISDPGHRHTITRAWHALSEGIEDHTATQLAALFGVVLRANEARIVQVIRAYVTSIRKLRQSRDDAGPAGNEVDKAGWEDHFALAATIKEMLATEILRAETARVRSTRGF